MARERERKGTKSRFCVLENGARGRRARRGCLRRKRAAGEAERIRYEKALLLVAHGKPLSPFRDRSREPSRYRRVNREFRSEPARTVRVERSFDSNLEFGLAPCLLLPPLEPHVVIFTRRRSSCACVFFFPPKQDEAREYYDRRASSPLSRLFFDAFLRASHVGVSRMS